MGGSKVGVISHFFEIKFHKVDQNDQKWSKMRQKIWETHKISAMMTFLGPILIFPTPVHTFTTLFEVLGP